MKEQHNHIANVQSLILLMKCTVYHVVIIKHVKFKNTLRQYLHKKWLLYCRPNKCKLFQLRLAKYLHHFSFLASQPMPIKSLTVSRISTKDKNKGQITLSWKMRTTFTRWPLPEQMSTNFYDATWVHWPQWVKWRGQLHVRLNRTRRQNKRTKCEVPWYKRQILKFHCI